MATVYLYFVLNFVVNKLDCIGAVSSICFYKIVLTLANKLITAEAIKAKACINIYIVLYIYKTCKSGVSR